MLSIECQSSCRFVEIRRYIVEELTNLFCALLNILTAERLVSQ